jgi:PAS domain S-box-containing protein
MATPDNEEERIRSVALRNAQSILAARRRAEEELRKQSEWLRITLASIGDAVISTDAEGRVSFMNGVAESLTGWSQAEALGRLVPDVFCIVNEQSRLPVENPALRALREGANVGLANYTVLIARDGAERLIEDSAAPIRANGGAIAGAVLVFRDVTERRRAEHALARSERELSDFFDNAVIGFRWVGPDGIILRANQAELDLVGCSREEYVGHHLAEFHVDVDVIDEFLRRLHAGQWVRSYPMRMRCKDGSIKDVLIDSSVLWEQGRFIHTRSFTRDVTDRKRDGELLRRSEQRLRFIMDSMPQKIFTATPSGAVDYFNPQWLEFTGLTFAQIKDWGWTQFVHPDDLVENVRAWRQAIASGASFHFEHRFRRADGEYRWHFSRAVPLRDADGNVLMWVGSNTDIHEQKNTADTLREIAAQLSDADRRKNEFLAMLAHELRNPLAPIRNALQFIRLTPDAGDAIRSAAEMMERQIGQMVRLVDDLLDVSRISRGKIELRCQRVALAAVIAQAVETCRPAIDGAQQQLTVTLPPQPVCLHADPVRLAQAFGNLLNNACKYTDRGGRIALTAERQGSEVVVSVKDSGVGIAPDMLPKIFEMFTQVDRSLDRSQGGLGIGLTLVQRLVEMHGGSVRAFSDGPRRGSEFVARLPILADETPPASPPTVEPPATTARRVLVVDDNRDSATSLAMLLNLAGNETHVVHDGLAAVEAAATFRPDIVLLDIGLPKLNGYEAARKIREQTWGKSMVLVALTGWGQEEDRRKSTEAGFDGHMVKPVEHAALMQLLAELQATPI